MGHFSLFEVFVLSRLADVGSTILNLYRFGYDPSIEISPVNRFFLERGIVSFILYQILIVWLMGLLCQWLPKWKIFFLLPITIPSLIVATVNIATLIATYFV